MFLSLVVTRLRTPQLPMVSSDVCETVKWMKEEEQAEQAARVSFHNVVRVRFVQLGNIEARSSLLLTTLQTRFS